MEYSRETDRFIGKVGSIQLGAEARRVAFVENQIQDVKHRSHSRITLLLRGHAEWNLRGLDTLLRTTDSLCHCRFRNKKRFCNLRRCQSSNGAKRQRYRR